MQLNIIPSLRRSLCTAALALLVLTLPKAARAADVSEALYNDMKEVIQELMAEEVAHTAVPNAVCQAPILLTYYPSSMQRLYDRQLGALKGGLRQESATLFGSFLFESLTTGTVSLRDFLRASWPKLKDGEQLLLKKDCAKKVVEANGPYYFARQQPNTSDFEPLLDRQCRGTGPNQLACELSLGARDYLAGDAAAAEDHLRRVLAALVGAQHHLTSAPQIEDLVVLLATFTSDPDKVVASFTVQDTALQNLLNSPNGAPLVTSLRTMARELRLVTRGGQIHLTFDALTDIFFSTAFPQLQAACQSVPQCQKFLVVSRSVNLRELLQAVSRSDVRAVAVEALRAAFSAPKAPAECTPPEESNLPLSKECDQQIAIGRYGRFAATLASYVLDANDGQPSEAARAAFRSASFDLLRTDGPRSGFDRYTGWAILFPAPALRFSWSPGYINESTANGFRYMATLDWLTFRGRLRYTESAYVAAYVSLIDALGPLSESALRKQSPSPTETGRVWNNFLAPRAEIVIGVPSLSTHLALVAGISYRPTAAFRNPNDGERYTYYSWLSSARPSDYQDKPAAFYSQFIESNIGIKYVP